MFWPRASLKVGPGLAGQEILWQNSHQAELASRRGEMKSDHRLRMVVLTLVFAAGSLTPLAPAYSQTQGMDRRDDRREDRQGARDTRQTGRQDAREDKAECKAGDEKSRADCRQDKRGTKQDARDDARDIKR